MKNVLFTLLILIVGISAKAQDFGGNYTYKIPELINPYINQLTPDNVYLNFGWSNSGGAVVNWAFKFDDVNPPQDTGVWGSGNARTPFEYVDGSTDVIQGKTYYYQFCASNVAGTACSPVGSVTIPTSYNTPTVSTGTISNITSSGATVAGNVSDDGGQAVTTRGICYNTTGSPTTNGPLVASGSGTGSFGVSISLLPGTTYYVRAYATNSIGTSYGSEKSFTTSIELPTVITGIASNITSTDADVSGEVTSEGGDMVYSRGICWNTTGSPTLSDAFGGSGSGLGTFTVDVFPLNANTTYYVRAYATNSSGTAYGSEVSFTTEPVATTIPTVTTASITNITQASATGGGNVTSTGGLSVTSRGVCWSTSLNPTTSNNKTTNGSGTGSFTSLITGLSPSTNYYVRAYATNANGTAYGDNVSFTSNSDPSVLDGFSPIAHNLKSGLLGGAGQPESMFIGANGTKIFMAESNLCANYFNMAQWDLTNSSSYGNALCLPYPYSELEDLTWKSDGSKFYQLANSHDIVLEYSTSTNWGFTDVTSTGNTLTTTVFETNPIDMFWGDSGQSLYIIDGVGQIHRYILSPAYNLSNPFYAGNTSVSSVESNTEAMWIDNSGTKMFVVGKSKKVHEARMLLTVPEKNREALKAVDRNASIIEFLKLHNIPETFIDNKPMPTGKIEL